MQWQHASAPAYAVIVINRVGDSIYRGTGTAISDHEVLTAAHVVSPSGQVVVHQHEFESSATIVRSEHRSRGRGPDLALLETREAIPHHTRVRTGEVPWDAPVTAYGSTSGFKRGRPTMIAGESLWFNFDGTFGDSGGGVYVNDELVSIIRGGGDGESVGPPRTEVLAFLKRCRRRRPSPQPPDPPAPTPGEVGPRGPGILPGTVTTGEPGTEVQVSWEDVGNDYGDKKLNLTVPRGARGNDGAPARTISSVTVNTIGPNEPARARLNEDGTQLTLWIPRGEKGEPGTVSNYEERIASLEERITRMENSRLAFNQYTDGWNRWLGGKVIRLGDLTNSEITDPRQMPSSSLFEFTYDIPAKIRAAMEAAARQK